MRGWASQRLARVFVTGRMKTRALHKKREDSGTQEFKFHARFQFSALSDFHLLKVKS
jgi:hypothetical protein